MSLEARQLLFAHPFQWVVQLDMSVCLTVTCYLFIHIYVCVCGWVGGRVCLYVHVSEYKSKKEIEMSSK